MATTTLHHFSESFPGFVTWERIEEVREGLRRAGRRVVVTNGVFDLLHVGHLRYLSSARRLGDVLWVGLNGDNSVRELKGPTRPIHPEAERAELLLALRMVDGASIFPQMRAVNFLRAVQPDIYVKGGDYTPETLDREEKAALDACGAEIRILELVPGRSTSAALKKLSE
jgi:D-glycero-beta-D-manno-heptose 1-phosphate adenylyltransferase